MKILDVHPMTSRSGHLVFGALDGPEPERGSVARRTADGAEWKVGGVEWWANARRPKLGEIVGVLLVGAVEPMVGDEIIVETAVLESGT